MLQTYTGYYEGGHIIPRGSPFIPEGSELIITVINTPEKSRPEQQREAFKRFMAGIEHAPPLPEAFDEIILQRINIDREVEL